jgi:HK97 family phage portal protein
MGILSRLSERPRAEVTTARSPATWFLDWLGGSESAAGVRVSESTALGLSAYYCGVNMISSTIGALPLKVYRQSGRMREVADDHPAYWLLHNEPNPEMTAMTLRQTWIKDALGRGNAFGEIVFDSRGNPTEIWPIPQDRMNLRRDSAGTLWYEVLLYNGEKRYLPRERVIHVPGVSYDGRVGYGLIQVAMESIGHNAAQEAYGSRFFRNGGNISGVLQTEAVLKDTTFARLKTEVSEKLTGLTNAHRLAILENGLKYQSINPTHEEAQLIESRRFSVEEWARWLNMPPHKLKEMTHATFSNIEEQNIEWVVDTITPWITRFEQEFNRKLFRNRNLFYTKHNVDGLLRGNIAARYQAYAIARNWGWYSANDVREKEEMNPLPGGIGDTYLIPANMMRADQPAAIQQAAAARLVSSETHSIKTKGSTGTYNAVLERRIQDMVGLSPEASRSYIQVAMRLNLIAAGKEIPEDMVEAMKVQTLMNLANGGEPHAIP